MGKLMEAHANNDKISAVRIRTAKNGLDARRRNGSTARLVSRPQKGRQTRDADAQPPFVLSERQRRAAAQSNGLGAVAHQLDRRGLVFKVGRRTAL